MSYLLTESADFSSIIGKILDYIIFALNYIKGLLTDSFYEVPFLGTLFGKLPLWVYGIFVLAVLTTVPLISIKLLKEMKRRTGNAIMGSKLGDVIENKRLVTQASKLVRQKKFAEAADLFLMLKDTQSALKVLEVGGEFVSAGKIYEGMGQFDKAAEMYEKAGDLNRLANALIKKGDHGKAAAVLIRQGKNLMAAEEYERAGEYKKSADLYSEHGSLASSAECYEKAKDFRKAAELFERAYIEGTTSQEIPTPEAAAKLREMSLKAGKYFGQMGEHVKSAEAFARCKEYVQAAEAALNGGLRLKAADYYITANMFEQAAQIYKADGNNRRACEVMAEKYRLEGNDAQAARMYLEAGYHTTAAELFEQSGDYVMAGDCHMAATDYAAAAMMYVEGKDKVKAAAAYIKAGEPEQAAQLYIQLGQMDKASPLVEQSGDYFLAAELYRKQGLPEKEMAALQRVPSGDQRYHSAVIRLAEIFKGLGNLKLAAESYTNAIGGASAGQSNLELYYGLGTVYEASKRYGDAAEIYQKILLVDYQFKDAGERKKNCEMLQAQPNTAAPATAPTARSGPSGPSGPTGQAATSDASKRYAIVKEIGRGGMGVVYQAKDNMLNKVVALKLLPKSVSGSPQMLKRFASEARLAARMNHPNIVTVFDFQQAGGRSFITMEYVDGFTLKKILVSNTRLPLINVLKIVYQCCQGLDYAHKNGILHRNIKPSNIIINKQNVIKLMDFGLARMTGEDTLTDGGSTIGTVMYMSPEQLAGGKLDPATDVYSLGLVFYEMVAGRHPFAEGDAAFHHVNTQPKPPKLLRPDIPDKLNDIILKCLQKEKASRFSSVAQLAMSLREVPLK